MAQARSRRHSRSTLEAALNDLSVENLACRDLGHAWFPFRADPQTRKERIKCLRCDTVVGRTLDHRGNQSNRTSRYQDGYLLKGFGQLSKSDRALIRIMHLERMLTDSRVEKIAL